MTSPSIPPSPRDSVTAWFSIPRIHWGWLLLLVCTAMLLFATRSILGPFFAGFIIAYLLDPVALRLQRRGMPRSLAALLVLGGFLAALAGLIWLAAPIVQHQLAQLIVGLPALGHQLEPIADEYLKKYGVGHSQQELVSSLTQRGLLWASESIGGVIAGGLAFFNVLALVVIAPVVAFYLLRDWPLITTQINRWWPVKHAATIHQLWADSDRALSGFVRGQSLVCVCIALLFMIFWGLIGLNYFFVLALIAGVLAFVPFVGSLMSFVLSMLIAAGQFGFDPVKLGLVVGAFVAVQTIEQTVLTPNLIGNRIGLHPVWVLFAVFAGGELAGIVGVFLAVPLAAVAGVIVRWSMEKYLASQFYGGPRQPPLP